MEKYKRTETQYVFLHLRVINGEYSYGCFSVHSTQCSNINFFAQRYAANFYGDKNTRRQGDAWFSHFGCVAIGVRSVKIISEEHFLLLQQYLE